MKGQMIRAGREYQQGASTDHIILQALVEREVHQASRKSGLHEAGSHCSPGLPQLLQKQELGRVRTAQLAQELGQAGAVPSGATLPACNQLPDSLDVHSGARNHRRVHVCYKAVRSSLSRLTQCTFCVCACKHQHF